MDPLHGLGADDAHGFDPARLRRRIADLGGPPEPEAERSDAPDVELVSGAVTDLASPSRPRRLSARMGLGAFVAAAAVVIGVVAFAPRPPEPVPTIAELREAAAARPVPAGPLRATVLETSEGQLTATLVEIRPDGAGGGTITYSPGTPPSGLGLQRDEPPSVWPVGPAAPLVAGFTATELQSLPSDADALRRSVDDRTGPTAAPAEAPKALLDLATTPFVPEGVRRAALEAVTSLADSPGGSVRDPMDREGVALLGGSSAGSWLVVLDPDTGWPLAFADAVAGPNPPRRATDVAAWTLWDY